MFIKKVHHQANRSNSAYVSSPTLTRHSKSILLSLLCAVLPIQVISKILMTLTSCPFFFADNFFFRTCYLSCNSICKTVKSSDFNSYLLTVELLSFILALFFGKIDCCLHIWSNNKLRNYEFRIFPNFLHTLEKDNKNRFEYFFALSELRIFKGIFDFGLPQKDIS